MTEDDIITEAAKDGAYDLPARTRECDGYPALAAPVKAPECCGDPGDCGTCGS